MSRSRAATPAGKRRSTARSASSGRRSSSAARKRPPSARTAKRPTGPTAKRRPAGRKRTARSPKRPATRRPSARRAPKRHRAVSWRYRAALGSVLLAALAAGYFFWLRDASLVAVDDVEVAGVTSGDREQIVAELTRVAEGMTTLHVEPELIEEAAAAFPVVESVSVDANFPHGMRIEVTERPPRMLVRAAGREVPVAADGTLLAGVAVPEDGLPVLEIDQIPPGDSLGGAPLEQALIVGATPEPLLPLIEGIDHSDDFGVELTLRGDLPVRFGTGARAAAKWSALAAVLADPTLDVATYVDVRVPERPAVGGAAQALPAT